MLCKLIFIIISLVSFYFGNKKENYYSEWMIWMSPIFKCLICRKDIERSTKAFWRKKGHLLCSTCLDNIDKKKLWSIKFRKKIRLMVVSLSESWDT